MTFSAGIQAPPGENHDSLWFIFNKGKLLIRKTPDGYHLPIQRDLMHFALVPEHNFYFGLLDGQPCHAANLESDGALPDLLEWIELRALFDSIREELLLIAGRANQLVDWDRNHRFCGRCGGATVDQADERAKRCAQCGLINYPRLSPAVIVAVIKGDRILLARNRGFKTPMFSVLAGFVEPGETLEACVEREIREEVGLSVKNIRYFDSQPWLFPNSLMIGFIADYAGGQITVDQCEIAEASWFSRTNLPQIPHSISIARRLIDWFINSA